MIQDDFIRLRDDGKFVWISSESVEWTAETLMQATINRNLTPANESAVHAIIDKLNRLQRSRPKIYPFVQKSFASPAPIATVLFCGASRSTHHP